MSKPTIFTDELRPYFDKEKNLAIPNSVKFPGQAKPKLKITEWWMLLMLNSGDVPDSMYENLVGSRTTQWRAKKGLKEKGYL